jgi:hypothetical protein
MAARPEPLPTPTAWYLHAADTDWHTARCEHCQARRCRNPIEVVSHRHFRSRGHVLLVERFWCRAHGREFAARWGITVEAESERSARYLTASEVIAAARAGQECEDPACHRPPEITFLEAFMLRGGPASTEHRFCVEHGRGHAARWRIDIAPAPEGGPR